MYSVLWWKWTVQALAYSTTTVQKLVRSETGVEASGRYASSPGMSMVIWCSYNQCTMVVLHQITIDIPGEDAYLPEASTPVSERTNF
jgi:hypothetical protein